MVQVAQDASSSTLGGDPSVPLQLHAGERALQVLSGASLIEPRRGPGHYQGGYSGFSFRIAKGVRYNVGGSRGTYMQGDESPMPIDTGTVTITDQRVVFQGTKHAREWSFAKLLGYENDANLPWTSLQVSDREKVSGFLYDREHTVGVRFRLALALAVYHGTTADFVAHVKEEMAQHDADKPAPPAEGTV